MTKTELTDRIAEKAEISKKDAAKVITVLFEAIKEEVGAGNKVQIIGFGSFEPRKRTARKGRNPQTGQEMQIKAATLPAFKAGKLFKDAVNIKKETKKPVKKKK
jgi:DNA-binding protein HU-beta